LAEGLEQLPVLPPEAYSRESIYGMVLCNGARGDWSATRAPVDRASADGQGGVCKTV